MRFRTTSHECPECGARYLSQAECRHHDTPVLTLPLVGCEEPEAEPYTITIRGVGVRARNRADAHKLALSTVAGFFGGDTKRAEWAMDRIGMFVDVGKDRPRTIDVGSDQ